MIDTQLFHEVILVMAMLIVMALVTTFATSPLLELLQGRRNEAEAGAGLKAS